MIFSNFIPGSKLDPADEPPTGDALSALSFFSGESTFDRLRRLVGVSSGKVVVCNKKQPSDILMTATAGSLIVPGGANGVDIRASNIINNNSNNSRLKKHGLAYRQLLGNNKSRLNTINHNLFHQDQLNNRLANRRTLESDENPYELVADENKIAVEQHQAEAEQLLSSPIEAHHVESEPTRDETREIDHAHSIDNVTDHNTKQRSPVSNNANTTNNNKSNNCWQLQCKYTRSQVQCHSTLDDCWMVIFDKVYNITDFVYIHPGGDFILFEYAGRDATHAFLSTRHGSSAYKMLDKYWIGILVDEELYYSNNSSYCSVYSNLSWRQDSVIEPDADLTSPSEASSISATSSVSSIATTTTTSTDSSTPPTTTTTTTPDS